MPDFKKLSFRSTLWGFGISAILVSVLLWFEMLSVSHLGFVTLWFVLGVIFGRMQYALVTLQSHDDDDDEPRGGTPVGRMTHELRVIPIPVERDNRRPRR